MKLFKFFGFYDQLIFNQIFQNQLLLLNDLLQLNETERESDQDKS